MKRLNTSALVPGMKTAEDVYTYSNQLILPKGLILTDKTITKLEFYSILSLMVEDFVPPPYKPSAEPEIPYSHKVKTSQNYTRFKGHFNKEIDSFRDNINDVVIRNAPLNIDILLEKTAKLLKVNEDDVSFFDLLHNMREYDDPTYAHSLNVALICNVFAGWLKFSEDDITLATACGLLHDIGKVRIPDDVLHKPGVLDQVEYSLVKTHASEGYNFLKDLPIDDHIKNAALMHHERCDGSGYPLGIKRERIDKFARLVAIADVYEAMTSPRVYRGPLCPFKVIELFENEGIQKYDTKFVLTFLENVVYTYTLNRVRLSNGMEGDIIYINKQRLSKPIVKCGNVYLDLSQEHDLYIDALL